MKISLQEAFDSAWMSVHNKPVWRCKGLNGVPCLFNGQMGCFIGQIAIDRGVPFLHSQTQPLIRAYFDMSPYGIEPYMGLTIIHDYTYTREEAIQKLTDFAEQWRLAIPMEIHNVYVTTSV